MSKTPHALPDSFELFTEEGNALCRDLVAILVDRIRNDVVTTKEDVLREAGAICAVVTTIDDGMLDIEPRAAISRFLRPEMRAKEIIGDEDATYYSFSPTFGMPAFHPAYEAALHKAGVAGRTIGLPVWPSPQPPRGASRYWTQADWNAWTNAFRPAGFTGQRTDLAAWEAFRTTLNLGAEFTNFVAAQKLAGNDPIENAEAFVNWKQWRLRDDRPLTIFYGAAPGFDRDGFVIAPLSCYPELQECSIRSVHPFNETPLRASLVIDRVLDLAIEAGRGGPVDARVLDAARSEMGQFLSFKEVVLDAFRKARLQGAVGDLENLLSRMDREMLEKSPAEELLRPIIEQMPRVSREDSPEPS